MKNFLSLFIGFIFSIGLSLSGMIDPAKVKGFLDIFNAWDYSLMFVMGGAVGVNLILFPLILRHHPVFSDKFSLPINKSIDKKLIFGSVLFGIGWGLSGICPGPALVNLANINFEIKIVFFIFLIVDLIKGVL